MNEDNKKFYDWVFKTTPNRWSDPNNGYGFYPFDFYVKDFLEKYSEQSIKLLDMGCGNGRTLECINNHRWEMWGIDYSEFAIKEAKLKLHERVNLVIGDFTRTTLADKYFDVIISLGAHEHIDPLDFSEVARLLKPSGVALIYLPVVEESQGKTWYHTYYKEGESGMHFQWDLSTVEWGYILMKYFNTVVFDQNFFICTYPRNLDTSSIEDIYET